MRGPMRGLSLAFAMLLSTAIVSAQRHPAPPPPSTPPAPPATSPTVLPFPPLMPQPAGGFTPGVVFPAKDNPVYSPNRRTRPGRYGAYGGGYFYAPDVQPAPYVPVPAAEPTGMLRLSGTPESAQVFVDGYYVATLSDIEAQRVLTLPSGPHRIELRASDYTPATFDVRIDPHDTVTYRAALEHVRPPLPVRAVAPGGPAKMYVIPSCYLGNVPPKAERLPAGCDIKRVQEIS